MTPRRSVLYMPGANARAMDKARTLDADGIIFDLEDAVAPDVKPAARERVAAQLEAGGYGYRELIVRVNGLDTPWGEDDISRFADLPIDGLLFPKVESAEQIDDARERLGNGRQTPLWLMIETPRGVMQVDRLAQAHGVAALVMGTSDLIQALRGVHVEPRGNIVYALQRCVLAARAAGVDVLDGVHLDFRNLEGFSSACGEARAMGFDGKTLIHPSQIDVANRAFGVDDEDVLHARAVLAAWRQAQQDGKGVAVVDGKLVENLHVVEAERVLAFAESVASR